MAVWAIGRPCSPIIATRSRKLNLKLKYQRTHRITISLSKCRPLKSSSTGTNCDICLFSPTNSRLHQSPPDQDQCTSRSLQRYTAAPVPRLDEPSAPVENRSCFPKTFDPTAVAEPASPLAESNDPVPSGRSV